MLNQTIGDHQPTITSFRSYIPKIYREHKKINWEKFKIGNKCTNFPEIAKPDQIELEAENIRKEIQKALTNSTINYQINIKCEHPRTIPK